MERTFSGLSNETGFMIYDNFGVKAETSGYKDKERESTGKSSKRLFRRLFLSLRIAIVGIWLGVSVLILILDTQIPFWTKIVFWLSPLLVVLVVLLASFMLNKAITPLLRQLKEINNKIELIKFKGKDPKAWQDMAEYHACEHKLIHLLERNQEVNLENLRAAPIFTPLCGKGKNQALILAEPSTEKLMETMEAARAYFQKVDELASW